MAAKRGPQRGHKTVLLLLDHHHHLYRLLNLYALYDLHDLYDLYYLYDLCDLYYRWLSAWILPTHRGWDAWEASTRPPPLALGRPRGQAPVKGDRA